MKSRQFLSQNCKIIQYIRKQKQIVSLQFRCLKSTKINRDSTQSLGGVFIMINRLTGNQIQLVLVIVGFLRPVFSVGTREVTASPNTVCNLHAKSYHNQGFK